MQPIKSLITLNQQQRTLERIYQTNTFKTFISKPNIDIVNSILFNKKAKECTKDEFITEFTKHFVLVSEVYCGVNEARLSQFTTQECAEQFLMHFPFMSVSEIKEAYSLASRGELDVDISAYFGQFTVSTFLKVLTAYKGYRQKILSAVREIEKADHEEIEMRKSEESKKAFEQDCFNWFNSQKENFTLKSLHDITFGQAKFIIESNLVENDDKVKTKAVILAEVDAKNKMLKASDKSSYKKANDFISEIASQKDNHHHVNSIYFKLLVYEYLRKCNVNNS
jgi:hypothetical protein